MTDVSTTCVEAIFLGDNVMFMHYLLPKVEADEGSGKLIEPQWATKSWFPF